MLYCRLAPNAMRGLGWFGLILRGAVLKLGESGIDGDRSIYITPFKLTLTLGVISLMVKFHSFYYFDISV